MRFQRPIQIIGGGVAGLALGIGLRQQGVPATIFEAGKYPRHRVCGEFISGRGQETLRRLGLYEKLIEAGASPATTAKFFCGRIESTAAELPHPALCLSRFALDELLAREFKRLGGELNENYRWNKSGFGEGVVRATGRHAQGVSDGWRWFGLKVHAQHVPMEADLEMHFTRNGYVGMCRLECGKANVCGLFRTRTPVPDLAQNWREWLAGRSGSALHRKVAAAEIDESSFCAVAGLSFAPHLAPEGECCIGDAHAMTPPLSGNGMSIAFESAELSAGPLASYSAGLVSWGEVQEQISRACGERFSTRLAWANRIQRAMFQPGLRSSLLLAGSKLPPLWRSLFSLTRR